MLLLTAHDHQLPVPHLRRPAVYDAMLGKDVKQARKRVVQPLMFFEDGEVWINEATLQVQPKKRTRRAPPQAIASSHDALLDGFPALEDDQSLEPLQAQGARDDDPGSDSDSAGPIQDGPGGAAAVDAAIDEGGWLCFC